MLRVCTLLLLMGCSTTPENPDPHREFNEDVLDFNLSLDENVVKPLAETYTELTNSPTRQMVSNFLDNWKEPFYFVNYTLRGDIEHVGNSLFRFILNSTMGILGLFDVAQELGLEKDTTGYKETLKNAEVPHGDYLVLPFFGSSSTRDAVAEPISWFMDPVSYFIGWPYAVTKALVSVVSDRAENAGVIDPVLSNSMDIYSTTRSLYLQKYGVGEETQTEDDGPSPEFDAEDEHKDDKSRLSRSAL